MKCLPTLTALKVLLYEVSSLVLNKVVPLLEGSVTFIAFKWSLFSVNQLMFQKVGALVKGPVAFVTLKGVLTLGRLVLTDRGVIRVCLRLSAFIWLHSSMDALTANELHTLVTGFSMLVVLTGCHLGMNLLILP